VTVSIEENMAEVPNALASSPPNEATPPGPGPVEELANVVLGMNRFLSLFAGLQFFKDAQFSVADWTVMMILLEKNEARIPLLALVSGIAEPRIVRIVETLTGAGLVTSAASPDPARPNPVMLLTDAGRERLTALNEMLLPFLSGVGSGKDCFLAILRYNNTRLMNAFSQK
jgi:DNA-binding MarR family transcriptional regulator